jgi:dCMP deaminase
MDIAVGASAKSKDDRKYGAVLIDGDVPVCVGYNGIPRGVQDLPERRQRPAKHIWSEHAERNVIFNCARAGIKTRDCVLFVNGMPCEQCARAIIQAGIVAIYYVDDTLVIPPDRQEKVRDTKVMLGEAGVAMHIVKHEEAVY